MNAIEASKLNDGRKAKKGERTMAAMHQLKQYVKQCLDLTAQRSKAPNVLLVIYL